MVSVLNPYWLSGDLPENFATIIFPHWNLMQSCPFWGLKGSYMLPNQKQGAKFANKMWVTSWVVKRFQVPWKSSWTVDKQNHISQTSTIQQKCVLSEGDFFSVVKIFPGQHSGGEIHWQKISKETKPMWQFDSEISCQWKQNEAYGTLKLTHSGSWACSECRFLGVQGKGPGCGMELG